MEQKSLFDDRDLNSPLASRLRPKTLEEVAGQKHLLGEGKILHGLYRHRRVYSYLPLPFFMQPERFFCVIHFISPVSQIIILEAATSIRRRA